MHRPPGKPLVAIACGGTGGHLFPGLAVAQELLRRDCDVLALVSPKEVDQQAVRAARDVQVATLPAVALQGNPFAFARASLASYQAAKKLFAPRPPRAVLAMGGFTSAPPVLAGKYFGAKTFLHDSNTIPGRANRWLAHFVDEAFVGFPQAAHRLWIQRHAVTGTPVREAFAPADAASCRMALGLDPKRPTLVITGGSQGATGLNDLALAALSELAARHPELQFLHLTGANDVDKARAAYTALGSSQREEALTKSEVEVSAAALPPHPNPLPPGEGTAQLASLGSNAPGSDPARTTSLPLPAGEGRGEGERRSRLTTPATKLRFIVQPFLTEMELALGAATLVVSRAGASSLAELVAMRVPAVLVPLPTSADDHQLHNARAFADTGAARLLNQRTTSPAQFAVVVSDLLTNAAARAQMQAALAQWHQPTAAADIAERVLRACGLPATVVADDGEAAWQPPARFAKSAKPQNAEAHAAKPRALDSAFRTPHSALR